MTPEAKRKLSHWCILIVFILYAFVFSRITVLVLLGGFIGFVLICEIMRLKNSKVNDFFLKAFDGIYREDERNKISTLIFTLSGLFFTILLFEKEIALLAVLFITFGDGFAALAGERYGRHKIFHGSRKSWEGTAVNFLVCILTGLIYSYFSFVKPAQIILGSIACAAIEAFPFKKDNLVIPVVAGFVMTIVK